MKRKLKRIRKIVGLMLSVVFLVNAPLLEASAAEQSLPSEEEVEVMECSVSELPEGYFDYLQNTRSVLTDCTIVIGFGSDGMKISIYTGTTGTVPVVGVKDIKVEQKVWYGWKVVAVSNGAELKDVDGISVSVTFTGAVKDETYRVSCVHYADLVYDGVEDYVEGYNNTGEFVFTY